MMELTIQQNKVFEQIKAFLNSDASVLFFAVMLVLVKLRWLR